MILLDTHVIVWLTSKSSKLSKRAKEAVREARSNDGVAIASISLYELAWLAANHRVQSSGSVDAFVRDLTSKMVVLPMTPEIAAKAVSFPESFPKDPQDRIIGATALIEGLPLVTADEKIRGSKLIDTIW